MSLTRAARGSVPLSRHDPCGECQTVPFFIKSERQELRIRARCEARARLAGRDPTHPLGIVLCSFEHPLEFANWIRTTLASQLERDMGLRHLSTVPSQPEDARGRHATGHWPWRRRRSDSSPAGQISAHPSGFTRASAGGSRYSRRGDQRDIGQNSIRACSSVSQGGVAGQPSGCPRRARPPGRPRSHPQGRSSEEDGKAVGKHVAAAGRVRATVPGRHAMIKVLALPATAAGSACPAVFTGIRGDDRKLPMSSADDNPNVDYREVAYRPFVKQHLYAEPGLAQRPSIMASMFPLQTEGWPQSLRLQAGRQAGRQAQESRHLRAGRWGDQGILGSHGRHDARSGVGVGGPVLPALPVRAQNRVICLPGIVQSSRSRPFSVLIADRMPDLHFMDFGQCCPRWTYAQYPRGASLTRPDCYALRRR